MEILKRAGRVALDAFYQFNADDGWAIASHIALSSLMALFPFFLVLTAVAGIFGSHELANEAARLALEAWPAEVAAPIALEIHSVLTSAQGDVLHFTGIDADETLADDQNFTFRGTEAFTAAGQINWFTNGTDTFLQFNTNADLNAEGIIQLNGVINGDAVLMFL